MIDTDVKIWYGWEVTTDNCTLDYRYGSDVSDRQASLRFGKYSSTTLCAEIERALLEVGVSAFSLSFDRVAKKFVITCSVAFNVMSNTGVSVGSTSAWAYLGFSDSSDKTGATTYTADNTCLPYEYNPQFKLQSLTSVGDAQQLRDPVKAESSSGISQLTHAGIIYPVDFEIVYITNVLQLPGSAIRSNPTGKEDANRLLQWATQNGLIEFIPDSSAPNTFYDLILTSTELSQTGTDYKLYEQYAKGLPNMYFSGLLKWRVYES